MVLLNPSNLLSLLRGPLAFVFLIDNYFYRTIAILLAMLTDCLDGYLARRYRMTSSVGAVLDPAMDKFFVCFIIGIFLKENRIEAWQALSLLSRDFAIILFTLYLTIKGTRTQFRIQSIWSGKITTTLQFFVLLGLLFHISIPFYTYFLFISLGLLAFIELYLIERQINNGSLNL